MLYYMTSCMNAVGDEPTSIANLGTMSPCSVSRTPNKASVLVQPSVRKRPQPVFRGAFGADVVIGIAQVAFAALMTEATALSRQGN